MFLMVTGLISGIISGLGMGGGTILILILTSLFGFDQHVAQASNILFFIPTSLAALYIHFKQKNIEKHLILKMTPFAILGAILGASLSSRIASNTLRKYFGIFLLLIAMYEILILVKDKFKENKKAKNNVKIFGNNIFRRNKKMKGE